jgi:hypothetical protein
VLGWFEEEKGKSLVEKILQSNQSIGTHHEEKHQIKHQPYKTHHVLHKKDHP